MNADPKWMRDAKKLDMLSYLEAIELAYYGASVIHPKTIKPLENADITLHVKSFLRPKEKGTVIRNLKKWQVPFPIFIRKQDQVLISLSPRDFSFILEENLSQIFDILAKFRAKVNVMQNSAVSFSICIDANPYVLPGLIKELKKDYLVRYNENLELITIRHYDQKAINRIARNHKILLEQKTRSTVHLVKK
jgi:aspartate kinase